MALIGRRIIGSARVMRIDDAAEQAVAHRQVQAAVFAPAPEVVFATELRRRERRRPRRDACARLQAVHFTGWHQVGAVAGEADHFGQHRRLSVAMHLAHRADGRAHAGSFEHEAGDAHQRAFDFERLRRFGEVAQVAQVVGPAL
jgi:hypothetical protein